ncbi:ClpX C4-type zinc finger protein [Mycobacterium sp. 23]|uniref:ClpX C4-type zinc finger protein n=1 Tax=Mycobacterium sp. 23 TaxID=3400424 RepID=UPI0022B24F71|nr:ClpX C4-type zinc finger protein [Mycobacterium gordonae]
MSAVKLACSFCLQDATVVQRLLAGASAHICDACVDSCVRILADPSVPFPDFRSEGDAALLARLAPAAGRAAAADTGLRGLVDTLRRRGVSWARIGQALGVTRQAAWERFN